MVAKKNDQKGQSIFEFVLFLPIVISLYAFLANLGGSINGAINQEKVTRGYFFARIKNNSLFPAPDPTRGGQPIGPWQRFGMHFIGWRERWADGGQVPLTTCYRLALPLGRNENDVCEQWATNTTQYIRPRVVFGACGATFEIRGGVVERSIQVSDAGACLLE